MAANLALGEHSLDDDVLCATLAVIVEILNLMIASKFETPTLVNLPGRGALVGQIANLRLAPSFAIRILAIFRRSDGITKWSSFKKQKYKNKF